jgi:hypothetical protein
MRHGRRPSRGGGRRDICCCRRGLRRRFGRTRSAVYKRSGFGLVVELLELGPRLSLSRHKGEKTASSPRVALYLRFGLGPCRVYTGFATRSDGVECSFRPEISVAYPPSLLDAAVSLAATHISRSPGDRTMLGRPRMPMRRPMSSVQRPSEQCRGFRAGRRNMSCLSEERADEAKQRKVERMLDR